MKAHWVFVTIALLISIPAVHGQQAATAPEPEPVLSVGLAPGDTLDAHFLDFPEAASLRLTVAPNGTIFVPYAGSVKVEGLMPDQAEQAVVEALKAKQIVNSPQVSLSVMNARNLAAIVFGEVRLPHPVPLFGPAPLSVVLSQAGGFTEFASFHVLIAHQDGTPPTDVELDRNTSNTRGMNAVVKPGDIVSVARAGSFFALGELLRPGIFPIAGTQHLTLLQALALAGGPSINAALSKARILRTVDGRREEIEVDLAKLHDGKIADPLIQTDDILFVPRSGIKVVVNGWLTQSLYVLSVSHAYGL